MLSIVIEIDPCLLLPLCVLYEIQNQIFQQGRLHKATKVSLPSVNRADMGVQLTQLISESVKASIHALKLHHDRIQSHSTH